MTLALLAFAVCLAGAAWPYLGYPACLAVLRSRRQPLSRTDPNPPHVSLIICAYNEAEVLRDRLENALALDYPRDQLEIFVLSDASDDATDEIAAEFSDRGIRLLRQEARRGKTAAIQTFLPGTSGEVLVFSDANSIFARDALLRLTAPFADPAVGFVSGRQVLEFEESAIYRGESLYRRYETWIKRAESDVGSVVGSYGSILAVRRSAWQPLADDEMNDFTLPLRIVVRGWRGIFEPRAICTEWSSKELSSEFRRRVRIVARGARSVWRVPAALDPRRVGLFAFQVFSHKVLRWLGPLFLAGMAASSVLLAAQGSTLGWTLTGVQAAGYLAAAGAGVPLFRRVRPIGLIGYFVTLQLAAAVGLVSALLGRHFTVWKPVASARRPRRVSERASP